MAGYMTKQYGNYYEGELCMNVEAGNLDAPLLVLGTDGFLTPILTKNAGNEFLCIEKTSIYDGQKAYRFKVAKLAEPVYFQEPAEGAYSANELTLAALGTKLPVRVHPLQVNDEFVLAIAEELTANKVYTCNIKTFAEKQG